MIDVDDVKIHIHGIEAKEQAERSTIEYLRKAEENNAKKKKDPVCVG